MFDSEGNDHLYVFNDYSVLQSPSQLSRVKGFEYTSAKSTLGGEDKVYFREIVSQDDVLGYMNLVSINGALRSVTAEDFDELELDIGFGEQPLTSFFMMDLVISHRDA